MAFNGPFTKFRQARSKRVARQKEAILAAGKAKKMRIAKKLKPSRVAVDTAANVNAVMVHLSKAERSLLQASKLIRNATGKKLALNMADYSKMLADKIRKQGLG